ncbi:MAG: sulfotransferase family protein [Alphaproteobacteria bacterium HGW-Alphaproteobacteria-6]|nr:MAG: sulfotransferase family protein [Alphaproteobacteria bacterium HGW-Alphaproteobacteria-6]
MTAPLKVINLGLPKSGTTTLGEALKRAGLSVADWKIRPGQAPGLRGFVGKLMYEGYFSSGDPLSLMPGFDAFTEIDIVRHGLNLWPQTDWGLISAIRAHHPGARFILTRRDPAKLSDSMARWSDLGRRRLPEAAVPGLPAGYGASDAERIRWIEGHHAFCGRVFAGAADYLEYDVEDTEASARIGAFLGLDLPWWGVANANPRGPARDTDRGAP